MKIVRYTKEGINREGFRDTGKEYRKTATVNAFSMPWPFEVETKEGVMKGKKDDFLVMANTEEGEIWVVDREIFKNTYERV